MLPLAGHAEGEHSVGGTLDTLRHTSAHDGGAYVQRQMHAGHLGNLRQTRA